MMRVINKVVVVSLLSMTAMLGFGMGWAQQDPGPGKNAGQKLDEAGRSIKKGLEDVGDTIRNQFMKARQSVHDMGVISRVYGRLHWDKTLTSCNLNLDVKNGVVTLRGSVPSSKAKLKAVDLAADTVGIDKVIDELSIQPASPAVQELAPEGNRNH
jgi:osmotically-inducible protein OsmY